MRSLNSRSAPLLKTGRELGQEFPKKGRDAGESREIPVGRPMEDAGGRDFGSGAFRDDVRRVGLDWAILVGRADWFAQ